MGHSRVVRISPGDSVVLNSAERAPFLLHVEILEGDLNFDPTRRENRELLKKIVAQEDAKRRKLSVGAGGSDLFTRFEGFGSTMPEAPVPKPRKKAPPIEIEVEEVDLVEQMYGARVSVRDTLPELTDSLPLPSGPQNKASDAAAWSRTPLSSRRTSFTPPIEQPPTTVITLEDYSERMRTAAVMLAQLNASLVPAAPETPGGRSWIPGTGWTGAPPSPATPAGVPTMPGVPGAPDGAGGKLRLAAAQAEAIRSRIMEEMMALEEERVERMTVPAGDVVLHVGQGDETAEDEGIVRRELNKADPSGELTMEPC
jgi:phosphatidylinositol 4-kinase